MCTNRIPPFGRGAKGAGTNRMLTCGRGAEGACTNRMLGFGKREGDPKGWSTVLMTALGLAVGIAVVHASNNSPTSIG